MRRDDARGAVSLEGQRMALVARDQEVRVVRLSDCEERVVLGIRAAIDFGELAHNACEQAQIVDEAPRSA